MKKKNRKKWCCQKKTIKKICWICNCWITGDIADFQKLIHLSALSKLMRRIKSKLLTNIYQSLIMTCLKLQLSKKMFIAFEGILKSSTDLLKTKQIKKDHMTILLALYNGAVLFQTNHTSLFGNQDLLFNFTTTDFSSTSTGLSLA